MHLYVTGHQFSLIFFIWVAAKFMWPATMTGVPNNQDCYTLSVPMEARNMDLGVPNLPLCCDIFVASLGGLKKWAGKSE